MSKEIQIGTDFKFTRESARELEKLIAVNPALQSDQNLLLGLAMMKDPQFKPFFDYLAEMVREIETENKRLYEQEKRRKERV